MKWPTVERRTVRGVLRFALGTALAALLSAGMVSAECAEELSGLGSLLAVL